MKIIEQRSASCTESVVSMRESCRAIIIKDGKILLSYENNMDTYMIPGGGREGDEDLKKCCAREIAEETGFVVNVGEHIFTVNEYVYNKFFISHYFVCEIVGTCPQKLTQLEIEHGLEPRWVNIEDALTVYATYPKFTPGKESLYKREYTVLSLFKKEN